MIGTGTLINGKYRLVRLLGDGGMGSVYEAQHEVLGTRVAIKLLHPELARRTGLVERFLQEARVAAQIRSPRVVQVMDVDRTVPDGHAYIVMELLEGEPLANVLDRQRKLTVQLACEYTLQILEALEAAHALGVIHRDLKPENVFVTFVGGRPMLKLIDFGIAKARPDGQLQKKALTVAGVIMGTAEYMAPEQARAANLVDARSDIYAVGVMLYEMIAGERPVSGDDARIIALKVERGEVKPLVEAAPEVPREIAGLVHRAMAPRPELRFASATEMRLALDAATKGKRVAPGSGTAALPARDLAPPPVAPAHMTSVEAPRPGSAIATSAMAAVPNMNPTTEPPVNTVRAPPTNAMYGPPPMIAPAPAYAAPPARKRRSGIVWLVTIPLLLGAGVVAAIVYSQSADDPEPQPIASTPATTAKPPPTTPATTPPTPSASLQPFDPGTPSSKTPQPRPPGPSPQPPTTNDGGGIPPIFPSGLPSTLPPIPSTFQLPSALPSTFPFPLPGPAPAPHQPQPAPSGQPI